MKFNLQREQLLRPLQLVTGVVERARPCRFWQLVWSKAKNGGSLARSRAPTSRCSWWRSARLTSTQPARATIPARKLADIWRSLGEGARYLCSSKATERSFGPGAAVYAGNAAGAGLPAGARAAKADVSVAPRVASSQLDRPRWVCHGAAGRALLLERHVARDQPTTTCAVATTDTVWPCARSSGRNGVERGARPSCRARACSSSVGCSTTETKPSSCSSVGTTLRWQLASTR